MMHKPNESLNSCWLIACVLPIFIQAGCDSGHGLYSNHLDFVDSTTKDVYILRQSKSERVPLVTKFRLQNPTPDPKHLRFLGKSCSCVEVLCDGTALKRNYILEVPGNSSKTISMTSSMPRTENQVSATANFERKGSVSEQGLLRTGVTWHVLDELSVSPSTVRFQWDGSDAALESYVDVVHIGSKAMLSISSVHVSSKDLFVKPVLVSSKNDSRFVGSDFFRKTSKIRLVFDSNKYKGERSARIEITINNENEAQIAKQFVVVNVDDKYGFNVPEQLGFGAVKIGEKVKRTLKIRSKDNQPFRILNSKLVDPAFDLAVNPPSSTHVELSLSFAPIEQGKVEDILFIQTDRQTVGTLKIRLTGFGDE